VAVGVGVLVLVGVALGVRVWVAVGVWVLVGDGVLVAVLLAVGLLVGGRTTMVLFVLQPERRKKSRINAGKRIRFILARIAYHLLCSSFSYGLLEVKGICSLTSSTVIYILRA
jgi:hypothetical protein